MAHMKRPPTQESAIIDLNIKYEDAENVKRRKRLRDDDPFKYDEKSYLPQKKRNYGLYQPMPKNRRTNSEDQDDDALIRETQAALKSLSGSWPDDRTSIYKSNESDENPSFQNLFEEKCNHRKVSPTTSTTPSNPYANYGSENIGGAEALRDGLPFREYNGKFKPTVQKMMQQTKYRAMDASRNVYQTHDFNELVDDSSNDQTTPIEMANGLANGMLKEEPGYNQNGMRKMNESVYGGGMYRMMPPAFAQNSAFRPLADAKRAVPSAVSGYQQSAIDSVNYMNYAATPDLGACNNADKDKYSKPNDAIKDEESTSGKSLDSPDSKHYTILQPAGVDSKAASAIEDIAREGVLSVAAVSSTSSPALSGSSNTQASVDKSPPYDRVVAPFSPASSAKGTYRMHDLTQLLTFAFATNAHVLVSMSLSPKLPYTWILLSHHMFWSH